MYTFRVGVGNDVGEGVGGRAKEGDAIVVVGVGNDVGEGVGGREVEEDAVVII